MIGVLEIKVPHIVCLHLWTVDSYVYTSISCIYRAIHLECRQLETSGHTKVQWSSLKDTAYNTCAFSFKMGFKVVRLIANWYSFKFCIHCYIGRHYKISCWFVKNYILKIETVTKLL